MGGKDLSAQTRPFSAYVSTLACMLYIDDLVCVCVRRQTASHVTRKFELGRGCVSGVVTTANHRMQAALCKFPIQHVRGSVPVMCKCWSRLAANETTRLLVSHTRCRWCLLTQAAASYIGP